MTRINWAPLKSNEQLEEIITKSASTPQLIFKYSSRCSLSHMMFNQFENDWQQNSTQKLEPVFLDILTARNISNEVESRFDVRHESPQILVIKNGVCVYNNSHMHIAYHKIKDYN